MKDSGTTIGIGVVVCLLTAPAIAQAPEKRAITFKDLIAMHRVSDPQISPDGKWIGYDVATPDYAANRLSQDVWIVPMSGGEARQLTHDGASQRARWSPDGQHVLVLSSHNNPAEVYSIPVGGGEPVRITSLSTGADNELWSPDGQWIAFTSRVYPDCHDDACNSARDAATEQNPVKAHVTETLLYRHWDAWSDGKRSHLFVVSAKGGAPRDLTPGANYDVPPFNLDQTEAIAFSPDSLQLCFTANTDKDQATSTNGDLFIVPVNGASEPKRITTNPGDDWGPIYSPDGKWIAYRAQTQPGYESDRWQLMLYDRATGEIISRTANFDGNVEAFAWSPDSREIYFQTEKEFELPIYRVQVEGKDSPKPVLPTGANGEFAISPDGGTIVFTRMSLNMPAEIFAANSDGTSVRQVTHQNGALLSQLDLPAPEFFWFAGAEGTRVEALLLRPPRFDASKKWPLLALIHGGPQVEWNDGWSYRWNAQVMAAAGYAVLMVNPRGSAGYGSRFEQEISRDWGGKVYEDLLKGIDAALAKYPFLDSSRMAAAGGSYGGYMVDWIATHTGRFKCLISHAGPWDAVSSFGSTEELWFMDWEFGGPPWLHPELYKTWSPSEYAAALGKYKTPTLVIAGELDYRVPYSQSLEFFTALQREGVPSKLVVFPDEGHWILKPRNSEFWYRTFLDWLATYLK
ncbi:MAG TPA: S9 family peptidase [Candidatus Acidoferrales bacterium]|nr:S9 family peptidase [Candidatus Acidoferrales bacterium]